MFVDHLGHSEALHGASAARISIAIISLALFLLIALAIPSDSYLLRLALGFIALTIAALGYIKLSRQQLLIRQLTDMTNSHGAQEKQISELKNLNNNYQNLLQELVPLWDRQTELAKSQMENGINQLTERFSNIHTRLQMPCMLRVQPPPTWKVRKD